MISSSAWILFHANALCLIRRLQPVARTNPLLAALAILAPAVLLVGMVWVNAHRATTLAAFLGGEEATAMVLAAAIVFAIAGFNVQHVSSAGRAGHAPDHCAP